MTAGAVGDAVAARLAEWERERVAERLWQRDVSLWSSSGAKPDDLGDRLGWLDLPSTMGAHVDELIALAEEAWADGYRQAAVLGMGGSSLAPELFGGLAAAGLATVGVGFAHALHTPYWVLRSIAGLPRADESWLVRAYRQFLIRATVSRGLSRLEKILNFCFPKSVILYAEKRR